MATSPSLRRANQPPPLEGYDLFSENRPLVEALRREGGATSEGRCAAFGRLCGGEPLELGRLANEHPPVLRTHDRFGERIDEVEFHPAWHELLGLGVEHGLHSLRARAGHGATSRAARFMTLAYAEAGVGCPLSMTFASVPALRAAAPDLAAEWEPRSTSTAYDPGLRPPAAKAGVALRDGDDGAPGRLGRARERDRAPSRSGDAYVLDGRQVVLLGADVRRVPRPGTGAGWADLLPAAASARRRVAQRVPDRPAQGQAREPLERVGGGPARGARRAPRRRRGPRRRDDHRDGRPHAARLRARLDRAHAARRRRGDPPRCAPSCVRPPRSPSSR